MSLPLLSRRRVLACVACVTALPLPATAAEVLAPQQRVVLSITGQLSRANAEGRADFDMAMLAALPQHSFSTRTPWDPQSRRFTGPLLRDVMAAAGAQGEQLMAVALNDYKVAIPAEDARRFEVIVARLVDDQPMRVRDRGPLFIVYPYDSDPTLRNDRYFARSAWQLRRIEVR